MATWGRGHTGAAPLVAVAVLGGAGGGGRGAGLVAGGVAVLAINFQSIKINILHNI